MEQDGWAGRLVRTIASEIRRHRNRQGMSAQELADRCAQLGYPIGRQVITNLENGHRDSISVPDLMVLGHALGVPPGLLIFPVGYAADCEPLPGLPRPTWPAFLWFAARDRYPDGDGDPYPWDNSDEDVYIEPGHEFDDEIEWTEGAMGAYLYAYEDNLIDQWRDNRGSIEGITRQIAKNDPDHNAALLEGLNALEKTLRQVEKGIQQARAITQHRNILLRPLPDFLAHLDQQPATP